MLEKIKGKKVKVLVASNSGAGTGVGAEFVATCVSSMITIFGELKDVDNNFVELANARTIYMNGFAENKYGLGGTSKIEPVVSDNSSVFVNKTSIITIAVIDQI